MAPDLVEWAGRELRRAALEQLDRQAAAPTVFAGAFVTSSTVTGTDAEARAIMQRWGALAESMEGAAAAQVCALFGVPFLEVRGISNAVGDRDRSKWQVERAAEAAGWAAVTLLAALGRKGEA
jgi:futalosine hydrolase